MKHNLTINLESAINQCRIARKLGRISARVQDRLMQKLHPERIQRTERRTVLLTLRAQIHRELRPKMDALKKANQEVFQIEYLTPAEVMKRQNHRYAKIGTRNVLPIEEDVNWWKAAEIREREAKYGVLAED